MNEMNDVLYSAGKPADSGGIQLVEMVGVVAGAMAAALALMPAVAPAVILGAVAVLALGAAFTLRVESVEKNEQSERDARAARHTLPYHRLITLKNVGAPEDLQEAASDLVGAPGMSRAELRARLSVRVGDARANEYLPLLLKYADCSTEEETSGSNVA